MKIIVQVKASKLKVGNMINIGNLVRLKAASTFRTYEVPRWVRAFEPDDVFLFIEDITPQLTPGRLYGRYVFVCPDGTRCSCDDLTWAEDLGPLSAKTEATTQLRCFRRAMENRTAK